jgi:lactoylglutathione lyase
MASYTAVSKSSPQNFSWQQTMLRIKDPKVTLPFYQEHFGFKLIRDLHFPEWKFSLYFLGIPRDGESYPEPGRVSII